MARLLILILLIVFAIYLRNRFVGTPKPERKKLLLNWLLWALVAMVVAAALSGRLHWIGGLLAMAVPFVRQLGLWFMQRKLKQAEATEQPSEQADQGPMDVQQARKLLNLALGYQRQDIVDAHRRLMQKNHPDQGGSDYLAAMLNEAKELLLKDWDERN
ncbi:MAG: hypothetical protein OIF35_05525 [Cellvibrionaceae bacterium]|nr:hypothetical protein [Cellvibrionaceae bacterium]MCV6626883.1 hypothetical protein [Cellvibrionaceae bacterium]